VVVRVELDLDRDRVGRDACRRFLQNPEVRGEEGREVASDDLRGRPPEWFRVHARPRSRFRPQIAGSHPGEEEAAQDRPEGPPQTSARTARPTRAARSTRWPTSLSAESKTLELDLDLAAGKYAPVCNLAGHYAAGMYADFAVK
jgi:hypothetical protein